MHDSRNATIKITFYYPYLVAQLLSREDASATCSETSSDYKRLYMVAGSGLFSLISQVFLTYFFNISLKISHFPTISQLFPIYFTIISHFSIISHLFPNYF